MNKEITNGFSSAVLNIMPMLGISNIKLEGEKSYGKQIESTGVIGIIGIIGELSGNVFFAMDEECAKKIASYMMGGMEVEEFGEFAQSAISELCNMLAANASMILSETGKIIDISTPTLINGAFTVSSIFSDVVCLEMLVEEMPFNIYLSLKEN